MIFVTSVNRAAKVLQSRKITSAISITDPELETCDIPVEDEPTSLYSHNRNVLRLLFHDIDRYIDDRHTMFNDNMLEQIIDFVNQNKNGNLLIHCSAGISRSSAIGLIAGYLLYGDIKKTFREILKTNKHIFPNRYIINLADKKLKLNGELINKVDNFRNSKIKVTNKRWKQRKSFF